MNPVRNEGTFSTHPHLSSPLLRGGMKRNKAYSSPAKGRLGGDSIKFMYHLITNLISKITLFNIKDLAVPCF